MADNGIQKLIMPQWGFSMTHGRVVEWLVAEGSQVSPGAEVLEVETDKAVGVVESSVNGTLRRHVARPGQEIPVGGLLAVVADPSVSDEEINRFVDSATVEQANDDPGAQEATPQFVEVAGRTLRYLKLGDGGEQGGGGRPLVLVHGFSGNLNNWLFNHSPLAADRAVYAVDLPGHGLSSKDVGDGSLDTLAAVLCDWLDAVGLSQVHLVGPSLGGAIVLALALQNPQRVLSCTLVASAALGSEIDAEFVEGMVQADRRRQLKPYLERLFADPGLVTRQLVDDMLKFKRVDGVHQALGSIAGKLLADGKQSRVFRERLPEIAKPILVLWGGQDRILPASHAVDLDPHCSVEILDHCGHMVQMEDPAEVNRRIADFLRNSD